MNRCECGGVACHPIYFAGIMCNNEKVICCMDVEKCGRRGLLIVCGRCCSLGGAGQSGVGVWWRDGRVLV